MSFLKESENIKELEKCLSYSYLDFFKLCMALYYYISTLSEQAKDLMIHDDNMCWQHLFRRC